MADGFEVRPELLAEPAGAYATAAELLRGAVDRARGDLAALGDVSGDDEQGRAFASRYEPVAAQGIEALGLSADTVASFGEGLRSTAEQYAAGDGGAAGGFADES